MLGSLPVEGGTSESLHRPSNLLPSRTWRSPGSLQPPRVCSRPPPPAASEFVIKDTRRTQSVLGGACDRPLRQYLSSALDPTHVLRRLGQWYGKLDGRDPPYYDYSSVTRAAREVSYGGEEEDFFTGVLSGRATDFVGRAAPEDQRLL